MGPHGDTPLGQNLLGDGPGKHQGSGEPPGEVAAAPVVVEALVADVGGVVGVAGPGQVTGFAVIRRAGVGVGNHGAQGGPGGLALKHSGEHLDLVGLLAGGGQGGLAGGPAGHVFLDGGPVQLQPGGHTCQGDANGGAVGFAENGVFHRISSLFTMFPPSFS